MKKLYSFILTGLLTAGFAAKADVQVFGNTTNGVGSFSIGVVNNDLFSGAFGFIPQENVGVSSVTLWLTGYTLSTEQYFDNLYIGIYGNTTRSGINVPNVSVQLGTLTGPGPNDGSTAAFTFTDASGPIQLEAGQEYWISLDFDYVMSVNGESVVEWDGGGTPSGDGTYDEFEEVHLGVFPDDTFTPAFTINTVPEPGPTAFMSLAMLFGIGRRFCRR